MGTIRVLISDDHPLLREGLSKVLSLEEDIQVIGEASNGDEAVEKARQLRPDVVLMDLNMPGMGGAEAIRRIKQDNPDARVLVLTVHDDDQNLLDAVHAGARGYVLKDVGTDELVQAIRLVHQGEYFIEADLLKRLLDELIRFSSSSAPQRAPKPPEQPDPQLDQLTARELEILDFVAAGCSNKAIAEKLFISEKTVKNHISSILKKLGLTGRTQAAIYALRNRWPQG